MAEEKTEGVAEPSGGQQVDVEKMKAELSEQFRKEIAGLNRKITELDEEKKALAEQLTTKDSESKTIEQRLADIERQREQDLRDAALREKQLRVSAEAAKMGIPEDVAMSLDKSLSFDAAVESLQKLSGHIAEREKALRSQLVNSGHKPGSPGETGTEKTVDLKRIQAIDIRDMGKMSDAQLAEIAGIVAE